MIILFFLFPVDIRKADKYSDQSLTGHIISFAQRLSLIRHLVGKKMVPLSSALANTVMVKMVHLKKHQREKEIRKFDNGVQCEIRIEI